MQTYQQSLKNLRAYRRRVMVVECAIAVAIVAGFFVVLGVMS